MCVCLCVCVGREVCLFLLWYICTCFQYQCCIIMYTLTYVHTYILSMYNTYNYIYLPKYVVCTYVGGIQ